MKIYSTLLLLFSATTLWSQTLYHQPFLSYLGSELEFTKISINGGLPYDGIGKKSLLEEIPENIGKGMIKVGVPASSFVDAFGIVAPKLYKNGDGNAYLQTDRFGNFGAYLNNNKRFDKASLSLGHSLQFQKRWKTDRNDNGLLDFHPGHRIYWTPYAYWNANNFRLNAHALYLNAKEWGGQTGYKIDSPNNDFGYSKETEHFNFLLHGQHGHNYGEKDILTWQFNYNQHDQKRLLPAHLYNGDERSIDAFIAFRHNFLLSHVKAGIEYHNEKLEEYTDVFHHEPTDRYWNLFATHNIYLTDRLIVKSTANLEKRKGNDWSFLPAAQLDYGIVKKVLSASIYGMTGRRLAKPVSYHFDWLTLADEFVYESEAIEKSQKAGMALNFQSIDNRFVSKLTTERNRFENKAIVKRGVVDNQLVFSSMEKPLYRNTVEWMNYGAFENTTTWFYAHFIYRWEHFSKTEIIPFQAVHSGQIQLQVKGENGIVVQVHHTVKSPQNLKPFIRENTPVFHRTDFYLGLNFHNMKRVSGGWKKWYVGLYIDNVINYYKNKKELKETGLLLFPFQEDILWNDPSLANVRMEIGYVF